ncbi:hypothetical protein MNBD_GAMMA18-1222 [hydrothermal vent metagenome]|uniref:Uncharacterized protein n=1 Tax=hydrothermal vent metagenome TaxID=652676 RepID=A0A3B0YWD0_9ZZZZ
MLKPTILLFITSLLFFGTTVAGEGHEHDSHGGHSHGEISSEKATEKALAKVQQLVNKGKVEASWAEVKASHVEQKTYGKGPEWVVTFNNSKATDESKRSLYLFFSLSGHYIAANHTGE